MAIITGFKSGKSYTFKNLTTEKMLNLYGGRTDKGTNVCQYTADGSDDQKWTFLGDKLYSQTLCLLHMIMLDSNMPYRNQSRIHYYCTPLQLPSFDTYNHHLNLLLFRKAGVNHHYRIHLVQRLCNRYRNCLH